MIDWTKPIEIVKDCRQRNIHFICHKGSEAGLNLHCRGVHDIQPSASYRLAKAFDIPIREIEPDNLETA